MSKFSSHRGRTVLRYWYCNTEVLILQYWGIDTAMLRYCHYGTIEVPILYHWGANATTPALYNKTMNKTFTAVHHDWFEMKTSNVVWLIYTVCRVGAIRSQRLVPCTSGKCRTNLWTLRNCAKLCEISIEMVQYCNTGIATPLPLACS